jgi:hypothetical protein
VSNATLSLKLLLLLPPCYCCCCCCCHVAAAATVDELPSALRLSRSQFRHRYHFDQPGRDDVLVMQSRLDSRARWASQLARDAGWKQ